MEALYERFAAFDGLFEMIELATLIFIPVAMIEFFWDRVSGAGRRLGETFANTAIAIVYTVTENIGSIITVVIAHYFISPFALFEFEMTPVLWLVAFLAADFTYYWMHRTEHEVRLFWGFHVVHHSSEEFNLSTAFRLSWVEGLFEWIFFIPMLLVGFDIVTSLLMMAAVVSYQTWIHNQKIGKLGWLDQVFNTPSAHRVHHGRNEKYLDKNYGGVLLIWDHLFGTYQAEEEKVDFGITTPVGSVNPFVINFQEYGAILRDIARARSLKDAWFYAFGRPGWKPENLLEAKE